MAYRTFTVAADATMQPRVAARLAAGFTPTEWAVIHLARRDRPNSTVSATPIGRMVRRLFGLDVANPLADRRLETLRRAAMLCWSRGGAIDPPAMAMLVAHGFGFDQIDLMCAHVRRRQ